MILHLFHVASLHDRSRRPGLAPRRRHATAPWSPPPTRSASRPSAVSQQVKRLERQTGVPLLERVGRGRDAHRPRPPPRRRGRPAAHRPRAGRVRPAPPGRHRWPATCGWRPSPRRCAAWSRPSLRDLLDAHPDLTLTLSEREPWDTVDLVASGQVRPRGRAQLGRRAARDPRPPRHHVAWPATSPTSSCPPATGSPAATRVSPRDLVDEDWIATPEGTICRQWLTRMYDGTGRLPRIAHQSMEFDSHLALVEAGLGIALVPRLGRAAARRRRWSRCARTTRCRPARSSRVHRRSMADSPAVTAVLAGLGNSG